MQGAGAGINGAAGKALEAQAVRAPPLRLDGVAGGAAAASSSSELELGTEVPDPAARTAAALVAAARRRQRAVTVRHKELWRG